MKGKIDKGGTLWIERAGEMAEQYCCYMADVACRDYCPQFGEPKDGGDTSLRICQGRLLVFKEFTDERGKDKTTDHESM